MPEQERYTEAEVRAVLKRAAERQHRADLSAEARASGLSLAELEHVAAAAGIEARHVRAALREAEHEAPASGLARFVGAPTRIHLERSAEGTLDDALWQKVVVELRRTFNTPGLLGELGTIREWRSNPSVRDQAEIQAEEVDGRVRLSLRRSWEGPASNNLVASGTIGGVGFTFGALLLIAGEFGLALGLMLLAAALTLAALVGARVHYRSWAQKQTDRFTALMDRLEGIVESHAPRGAVGPLAQARRGETPSGPAPPLADALDDESEASGLEGGTRARQARTRS